MAVSRLGTLTRRRLPPLATERLTSRKSGRVVATAIKWRWFWIWKASRRWGVTLSETKASEAVFGCNFWIRVKANSGKAPSVQ